MKKGNLSHFVGILVISPFNSSEEPKRSALLEEEMKTLREARLKAKKLALQGPKVDIPPAQSMPDLRRKVSYLLTSYFALV